MTGSGRNGDFGLGDERTTIDKAKAMRTRARDDNVKLLEMKS